MSKAHRSVGKVSKPGDRFHTTRKPSDPMAGQLKAHNQRVGETIAAYNAAHASCFLLFLKLAADDDYHLAHALWHTARSDSSQRAMLEACARHSPKLSKTMREAILWSLARLTELSSFRNDAAHTEMQWYYDRAIPGLSTKEQTRQRLERLPFETHWKALLGDLWALDEYIAGLNLTLAFRSSRPLHYRPRLRLATSTSRSQQAKARRAKKRARQRPHSPSQA